ncbi:formylmethanofuran dehydrogenase subunit C [Candidatus Hakubella thermalkaliphila]|uniref:Formylmethanofuran dehydrogenase subunit C n=3 Tax=Candidatus Hakubella thermalkaliphila TaxID=2754717 RepID=A0A6V8NLJ0_9ACTN|nr:formylmethanofuran dehydrogenase subunit C [Candidatus Hakubella thermalkaliphila]GFP20170.1 formylmethanofuran dehydrogenase subunit C [Candidatus Hakubella thermalkaliphila]GFP30446.1 formylmethanofuran dehydrogenase subunit C [Candidatus Hakubella thermalkaliphila]GFP39446.1 formylmethanofuran dehydrogenase subunit C [Candidatus Hakubella thermalkaliphila]
MDKVILRLKERSNIPVEAEAICPDLFLTKSQQEIEELALYYGNKGRRLGDFFQVQGERSDNIVIEGEIPNFKKIGQGMSRGNIHIQGDVGMHLGALMKGGRILVEGNVSDWLGAEMEGGSIRVKGNAGHLVGAAYRGSSRGMRGGEIIVEGDGGSEVGELMRRGLIVIGGRAGDFVGAFLIAGTIVVLGPVGLRPGAGMKRGTIVAFQEPDLLPTFHYNCLCQLSFLRIYLHHLREEDLNIPQEYLGGFYKRYNGDTLELGKGEILVWAGQVA